MKTDTEKAAPSEETETAEDAVQEEPTEPAEAEAEEKKPEESEPEPPQKQSSVRRALELARGSALATRVLVLLVLAACVITAGLQWREAGRLNDRESTREQIRTRAGEFGQALLSYNHSDPDAARKRVLGLSATDFAKSYDVAFNDGLRGIITKLKADATASVRTVYVDNVQGDNAKAIVVMDSEVKSTAGTRRVLGSYLEMDLVRQSGAWMIKSVNSIGALNESLTKPDGTPVSPSPSSKPSNDPLSPPTGSGD
ncbi:hypothetical protein J4573_10845 [Actinomadura barringtoniae]|uniref:Mce-associated membrane protein n=1 Tax=Actinomadura barringtoniae TaxID=1427535 RepID=A0A939P8D6_9ACTN|nr:hypothetical protein [Actinomadura barringtoniae]MBO2447585.1 hypothetical protein [Actinomadura barringtoniae]